MWSIRRQAMQFSALARLLTQSQPEGPTLKICLGISCGIPHHPELTLGRCDSRLPSCGISLAFRDCKDVAYPVNSAQIDYATAIWQHLILKIVNIMKAIARQQIR
jgi:hypothetical protein